MYTVHKQRKDGETREKDLWKRQVSSARFLNRSQKEREERQENAFMCTEERISVEKHSTTQRWVESITCISFFLSGSQKITGFSAQRYSQEIRRRKEKHTL